jgi:hypothetical protein
VSLEDYIPKTIDPLIPFGAYRIKVSRNILNVISSRLKRLSRQAEIGIDRGDMSVDEKLLKISTWVSEESQDDWLKWSYERWLSDPAYRKSFLNNFNLYYDSKIRPSSSFGGGSSFSNTDLGTHRNDPLRRWEQANFPDRVILLLFAKGLHLLEEHERQHVISEYERRKFNGKQEKETERTGLSQHLSDQPRTSHWE